MKSVKATMLPNCVTLTPKPTGIKQQALMSCLCICRSTGVGRGHGRPRSAPVCRSDSGGCVSGPAVPMACSFHGDHQPLLASHLSIPHRLQPETGQHTSPQEAQASPTARPTSTEWGACSPGGSFGSSKYFLTNNVLQKPKHQLSSV